MSFRYRSLVWGIITCSALVFPFVQLGAQEKKASNTIAEKPSSPPGKVSAERTAKAEKIEARIKQQNKIIDLLEQEKKAQERIAKLEKDIRIAKGKSWQAYPGIMYLAGYGGDNYIASASVNGFGYVQVSQSQRRITRVFPSVTFVRTNPYVCDAQWARTFLPWCFETIGFVLGFNEGVNNEGSGFAVAFGYSLITWTTPGVGHFSFFIAGVFDPTTKVLPSGLQDGDPYPFLGLLNNGNTLGTIDAINANARIPIQLKSIMGTYTALGFSYTVSL